MYAYPFTNVSLNFTFRNVIYIKILISFYFYDFLITRFSNIDFWDGFTKTLVLSTSIINISVDIFITPSNSWFNGPKNHVLKRMCFEIDG